MPRVAREKGPYSTYHVIMRGNERKAIFNCDEDRFRFIDILRRARVKLGFVLHAYCLMTNHVHLLIGDNGNDISKIMHFINSSYALYFNHVNQRCGHLFQDRFNSEVVRDDDYLLEASRYIHNNPVKAKMVKQPEQYFWSSFNDYLGLHKNPVADCMFILDLFSPDRLAAVEAYGEYVRRDSILEIIDVPDEWESKSDSTIKIRTKDDAKQFIIGRLEEMKIESADLMCDENILVRDDLIRFIRTNSLLSLRDIGALFGGLSVSRISRIVRQ